MNLQCELISCSQPSTAVPILKLLLCRCGDAVIDARCPRLRRHVFGGHIAHSSGGGLGGRRIYRGLSCGCWRGTAGDALSSFGREGGVAGAGGDLLHQLVSHLGQLVHAVHHVVTCAHVNQLCLPLLLAHHQDVIVLFQLGLADLLLHLAVRGVNVGVNLDGPQCLAHLPRIQVAALADGHDHHLAWRQPQGPLAGVVLGEDGEHALHGAQDGSVQDHRLLQRLVLRPILQIELDR
mmetsp:Transcript_3426/g.9896  ORF Transcript_3426/g.9896 Transcript_3426/m.9896 type:complete len:236 (-) Transcript_3426:1857-2564(-)